MLQRLNHRLGHYGLLIAVSSSLFLVNLGGPALWDLDEGRNATAAMEMRESGDWIVPKFNGDIRAHKPALLYWLQVAAYTIFGVNEFAARLPSALAAILTVIIAYELGRRMFDAGTGLLGALVLASSALFCAAAHFANPDSLLVTFTTAALLCFWLGFSGGQRWFYLVAGAMAGLAMLAKGPVGLVLPGAVVVSFLLWSREWRVLIDRIWVMAFCNCLLVALPWYVLVSLQTKTEFVSEFLFTHHLDRALNPMEGHSGPTWYYIAVLLMGLTPWSSFFGSAVWYGIKEVWRPATGVGSQDLDSARRSVPETGHRTPDIGKLQAFRFLWCWVGIYLLAFTLVATKLPNYVLPVMPPLALVIAHLLERWRKGELDLPVWTQLASLSALAFVGVAMIVTLLIASGVIETDLLRSMSWPRLGPWAALGAVPILGAAVGWWCLWRRKRTAFVAAMLITAIAFLGPLAAGGGAVFDEYRAPRPLVASSKALQRQKEVRIACFRLEHLPSLNFYVQRSVQYPQNDRDAMDFLRQDLEVFLFLPMAEWERLASCESSKYRVVNSHRDMYRNCEVVVVSNR